MTEFFGRKDTHDIGLDLEISTGEISPREIWENKDHYIGLATTSRDVIWDSLTEEEREALFRLARCAVETLHANVGAWVPVDLKAEGGEWVDVDFLVTRESLRLEIENDDAKLVNATGVAKTETLEMLEGLDND